MKRVAIIGGGFAGLNAAKQLGNVKDCEVTILDRRNHHLFQPLLYQVAMAGLDPSDIASPIRSILRRFRNTRTLLAEATAVDVENRTVQTDCGEVPFDYLVIACGATHDYFGNDQWEEFAPGLKNIPQATEIRRRVLSAFEEAERCDDQEMQREWLTFVIVGGGPTGVELAGAIAEMARFTLKRDFKTIDVSRTRVVVVQGGDRVLEQFPENLSNYGKRALESLGVEVRLGQIVSGIDARGVDIGEDRIPARTVIWAAGVKASPIGDSLGTETDRMGRVVVNPDLSIDGHPEIFVIGDQAATKQADGSMLPGIAPVAIQQGRYVGKLIRSELDGEATRKPFEYFDKGQMATIGRRRAVLMSGPVKLRGTLAWFGWLLIHLVYLNGFRNRFFVMFSWAWSYLTFARGARLIVPKNWKTIRKLDPE